LFPSEKVNTDILLLAKKPLEKEKIILQYGTIETSDVESKDTFFG
jgi:hypothetical protein